MMVKFLSVEWLEAFDASLRGATPPIFATDAPDGPLVIQHVVLDDQGSADPVNYAVILGRTSCGVTIGHHDQPTVIYTQTVSCAASVASRQRSAHDAVMVGDLQISGDVAALVASADLLAWLSEALAHLRERTEFAPIDSA